MNYRPDETWHRLINWTEGSSKSERLATQILYEEGFKDINPSHPLGGADGGKDARCTKAGKTWIMAVYFPRGQKSISDIKGKFTGDLQGVAKTGATGIAFVTNQELRLAERRDLEALAGVNDVEIFHLERISAILDKPTMAGVRAQFLDIDFSNEDLKQAFRAELSQAESRITGYQIGGDSFCYWMLYNFNLQTNVARDFVIIRQGTFPLYDVRVRIVDMNANQTIFQNAWGEISAPAEFMNPVWNLQSEVYYRVFFHARNGQWHQDLQLKRSENAGCWLAATTVSDTFGRPRFEHIDNGYVDEFGAPTWNS